MRKMVLAAALTSAAIMPVSAITIDESERDLYDNSIECMAYFGIMAGLGEGEDGDPALTASGAKFMAVATVLAEDDEVQVKRDFDAEMARLLKVADSPDGAQEIKEIDESCRFLETLVDAMIEAG